MLHHLPASPDGDFRNQAPAQLVIDDDASFDIVARLQGSDDKIRRILEGRKARDGIQLDSGVSRLYAIDRQLFAHALEHRAIEIHNALPAPDGRHRSELEQHILGVELRETLEFRSTERGHIGPEGRELARMRTESWQ